jgi:hypothetical protein
MDRFINEDLKTLLAQSQGPCVSIYTPTHRGGAEADPILWREQLNEAEQRLMAHGLSPDDAAAILGKARSYLKEPPFWKMTGDGLALFVAPGLMRAYRLPFSFTNQVVVGPQFEITPLVRWLNRDGRFYILAVSQNHVRFLEGTAHTIQRLDVPGMPASEAEARRTHDRDEVLNLHSHPVGVGGAMQAIFHGQGVGIDDRKDELLHYFQQIDRSLRPILDGNRSPLVLATIDYLAAIYRSANKYQHLFDEHLKGNPDRLSDQELHDKIWPMVAPIFQEASNKAIATYQQLRGTGRTVDDLKQLLPAVHRGEIETLFVVNGRQSWGKFDAKTGAVEQTTPDKPGAENLVNLAVSDAIRLGRTVHVVEPSDPFNGLALAGMYFLPLAKHGK